MRQNSKKTLLVLVCFILAIAPVIALGKFLASNPINLIFGDEWVIAATYVKMLQGNLTFQDLMSQHNESRLFFPELIFFGLANLTGDYNTYRETILMFITAGLVSLNIFMLSRLTLSLQNWQHLALLAIANLLIFSPMQWENWIWGIQLIVFIPIASITTVLVLTKLNLDFRIIAVLSAALCTFSTFSYANGMLSWVVVFFALVIAKNQTWRQIKTSLFNRKITLSLWLIVAFLNISYYFHNYTKPSYHPSFLEGIKKPIASLLYFLTFIGSPLGAGSLLASQIIGAIGILVFGWVCFENWKSRSYSGWLPTVYPWFCIAIYSLLSAVVTTGGRVGFGIDQAMAPRYVTFSSYFWVATIYLVTVVWSSQYFKSKKSATHSTQLLRWSSLLLLGSLLAMQSFSWSHGYRFLQLYQTYRLYGKSCILAQDLVLQRDCLRDHVFPPFDVNSTETSFIQTVSKELDNRQLLKPGLITAQALQTAITQPQNSIRYGKLDTAIAPETNGTFTFGGWAALPELKQPAHGVLLTAVTQTGMTVPIAIAPTNGKRPDVVEVLGRPSYRLSGWMAIVPAAKIPPDATQVLALGINAQTGQLHLLKGNSRIERTPQPVSSR